MSSGDESKPAAGSSSVTLSPSSAHAKDPLSDCPLPRFDALRPIKYGLLVKEGHSFRTWKKRLCVLEGRYLYYFVNEDDRAPRGVLSLDGCTVQEEPQLAKERKTFCFSVTATRSWNVSSKRVFTDRKYFFTLSSFGDMCDWMSLLNIASSDKPRYADLDPI